MHDDETPVWKREFPVGWVEDHLVTRRAFTRSLVGVSCASFAGTATLAARRTAVPSPVDWPALALPVAEELALGASRVFDYPGPGNPCLLIRTGVEDYVAYEQRCTHLGCPVVYRPGRGDLQCPCHEGYFSAEDGSVISGPPPRPLRRVELERRGGVLTAVGIRP